MLRSRGVSVISFGRLIVTLGILSLGIMLWVRRGRDEKTRFLLSFSPFLHTPFDVSISGLLGSC